MSLHTCTCVPGVCIYCMIYSKCIYIHMCTCEVGEYHVPMLCVVLCHIVLCIVVGYVLLCVLVVCCWLCFVGCVLNITKLT